MIVGSPAGRDRLPTSTEELLHQKIDRDLHEDRGSVRAGVATPPIVSELERSDDGVEHIARRTQPGPAIGHRVATYGVAWLAGTLGHTTW